MSRYVVWERNLRGQVLDPKRFYGEHAVSDLSINFEYILPLSIQNCLSNKQMLFSEGIVKEISNIPW